MIITNPLKYAKTATKNTTKKTISNGVAELICKISAAICGGAVEKPMKTLWDVKYRATRRKRKIDKLYLYFFNTF